MSRILNGSETERTPPGFQLRDAVEGDLAQILSIYNQLVARARVAGKHVMVGGLTSDNEASLKLHEQLGFERVGCLSEVGSKFGRFLDLVLVQRVLDDA